MEDARRSIDKSSDIVVKRRTSSGCLIVRKKIGDGGRGGGSAVSVRGVDLKTAKRQRVVSSESESSDDELPGPSKVSRRGTGNEPHWGGNVLAGSRKEGLQIGEGMSRSGVDRAQRNKLDVFEFDEYEGIDGEDLRQRVDEDDGVSGRQGFGFVERNGRLGRELEYGSTSRHVAVERRKNMYFDEASFGIGNRLERNRSDTRRDRSRTPPLLMRRDKHEGESLETIRVQGKNGVLKILVNKKRLNGSANSTDQLHGGVSRKLPISEDMTKNRAKPNPLSHPEMKRAISGSKLQKSSKNFLNGQKHAPVEFGQYDDDWDSDQSDDLPPMKDMNLEKYNPMTKILIEKKRSSHPKVLMKAKSPALHPPYRRPDNWDSEDSDAPPKPKHRKPEPQMETWGSKKENSRRFEAPLLDKTPEVVQSKDKKNKRGSGTEKQKLRERIREMLLDAGWTIDYRPRRNRDYQDAVYISPSGTAYWSIIKAYEALQKQLSGNHDNHKSRGEPSAYLISDETLGQLTRKTKKKMEKELKMKQREAKESAGAKNKKKVKTEEEAFSMDSESGSDNGSTEDKLSTFMKQGGKSLKSRPNENCSFQTEDPVKDRKSKILGRCTLLARSSDKGSNSETDGFVPYNGRRTLLSWLVDSGVVEVDQKVQYMNERRTWVLLEGWITDDGIHCGCCSKILTVSKFEIHAGSKLSQTFENICVESGDSLLQCQIDAWNRQDEPARLGFYSVESVGDDPNDDTCAICGDGGDLICCDGCPSTFHQNCLRIPMLPPGDWHCPYCICKYCGKAVANSSSEDNADAMEMLTCNLCDKKFHKSCVVDDDGSPLGLNSSLRSFCSQKCGEVFKKLQKYLGVKHELEDGFSWSIVRRSDIDPKSPVQELAKRVESNSKLAVVLTIMDECFLPIIDRRSRINMIHHVVYNSGSNFNRLNYSGFYTAVLERGDEIVSAASLRFHGTQLAEMPFIGTRHIYRRQGMCRRLFSAIQSALYSLKVEKLVIPAISELMDTWTLAFGFTPVEESLRQEMRSLNMLVFPGLDMLQKILPEQDAVGRSTRASLSGSDNSSAHEATMSGKDDSTSIEVKNFEVVSVGNASTASSSSDDDTDNEKTSELSEGTIPENNLANKVSGSTIHEDILEPSKVRDEARDAKRETMLSDNTDEKEVDVACDEPGLNTGLQDVGDCSEVETSEDFLMSECKEDVEKQQSTDRASPRYNLCLDNVGTSDELRVTENISSSDGMNADDEQQVRRISPSESNICDDGEGKGAESVAIEDPWSRGGPPSLSDTCHVDTGTDGVSEVIVEAILPGRADSDNEKQLLKRSLPVGNICHNIIGNTPEQMGTRAVENGCSPEEMGDILQDLESSYLTCAVTEVGNKTTDGHSRSEPDESDMLVNSMLLAIPESMEQELSNVIESKDGNSIDHENSCMEIKAKESSSSVIEPSFMDGENGASDLEPGLSAEKLDGEFDDALEMDNARDASLPAGAPLAGNDGGD